MSLIRSFINGVKRTVYFPAANYFAFWARIVLRRWKPRVIAVTGSSGKTTMLNMLDAQIGIMSHVSHGANSAFGIPLDILGLKGITGSRLRWLWIFAIAPVRAFTKRHEQTFYIAEADSDRPGEALFIGKLLNPEVTIWVSSSRAHGMNFESIAKYKGHERVEITIAEEYAQLAKQTTGLVLADGDNPDIAKALEGIEAKLVLIKKDKAIKSFGVGPEQTVITLDRDRVYSFNQPQPPAISHQVAFLDEVLKFLDVKPDYEFSRFEYPPGRSSVFEGKDGFTIIDSTYNSNLDSMRAILEMFKAYQSKHKVLVVGDLLEQGTGEAEEHKRLGELISGMDMDLDQVVLYGRRVKKYTYPILTKQLKDIPVSAFTSATDVIGLLDSELDENSTVLLKGAGFMEAIVEELLKNKNDRQLLARRGEAWDKRRKALLE